MTAEPKNDTHPLLTIVDAAQRMDAWRNEVTGVGMEARTRFEFHSPIRISDQQLDDLYYGDPYAARVCDCVPEEAMRRGFSFRLTFGDGSGSRGMNSASESIAGDPKEASAKLHQYFDAHHLPQKTREAWTWGRVWGGGFLLLGVNDGRPVNEPLDLKNAKEFLFAASCDKTELQPIQWYDDPERANFGEPSMYQLVRQAGISVDSRQIHATRVIRFDGSMTVRRRRLQNNSWSESVLQRVHHALRQFNGAYAAVSSLMQEASLRTIGIKDLAKMMAADSGNLLKQRLATMDYMTSVARAVLFDKDFESVSRVEVGSLSGLADMLRMYVLFLAGAYHIPVTVLMGQAPAGLNATGDSDVRLFYDRIDCDRRNYLKPRLIRLATIVCACDDGPTNGVVPRIDIDFPSMYATTPAEEADMRAKMATADAAYVTSQVLTPDEVATSRFRATGWSYETEIDEDARRIAPPDDETVPPADGEATPTKDAASTPVPLTRGQVDSASQVVERVAARTISRDAGIAMLQALGLDPARAEAVMGATGTTHFSKPAPEDEQKHIALQLEHSRLKRAHGATKRMLDSVLARAKEKGLDIPPIARREPGRDDETDDDVREGNAGDAQLRPAPEGPPYTPTGPKMQRKTDAADWLRRECRFDAATGAAIVLPLPQSVTVGVVHAADATSTTEIQPADRHCTLVFLGDAAEVSPEQIILLRAVLAAWASQRVAIAGKLSGTGRFVGETNKDPVYVSPDCPGLVEARAALITALGAIGVVPSSAHGFVPHVTIAYVNVLDSTPMITVPEPDVTFDRVELWIGGKRESFAFGAPTLSGG